MKNVRFVTRCETSALDRSRGVVLTQKKLVLPTSLSLFRAARGEERGWPRRERGEREERSGGVGPRRSRPTTQLPFWANVPLTAGLQATMPFSGIFIQNF